MVKQMSNVDDTIIKKNILDDITHVENFPLETNEGTKRVKEKFFQKAASELNEYIDEKIDYYEHILGSVQTEISERLQKIMPRDKSQYYATESFDVDVYLDILRINLDVSNSFRLKLDDIISSIRDGSSLEDLHDSIHRFIERFHVIGIDLSLKDFDYTMFTEKYMASFFANSSLDAMKPVFENIFFTCPDIKMQLKMNLSHILRKYDKELGKYVVLLRDNLFQKYSVNASNVVEKYTSEREKLGRSIAMDEYHNTNLFLEKKHIISDYVVDSPTREKMYSQFVIEGDYCNLTEEEKIHFNSSMMGLYLTLKELEKYYHYESILKDLLDRYKNREASKTQFLAKKKEIESEEKKRLAILKEYSKASGVGFLARKNDVKMKNAMLKMNEQIKKLNSLYDEYYDLEITYNLCKLSDSASIYDLLFSALTSFYFLEKSFTTDEKFNEVSLLTNIDEFIKFLYNPNNFILRKINVFTDYDIASIVAEKYRLLDILITPDMIDKDSISSTLTSVSYVNLIQNVEQSNIDFHTIENICKMVDILKDFE